MADTVGMADIRGLDIDKAAKGFGKQMYSFLQECTVTNMPGDHKRWFQKTAGTLTSVSPSSTKNVSAGSRPTTLEVSWTRNTSYKKKYFVEGFLAAEDISDAEIDTLSTTIRDLTEVVVRDRDADIWDVMTESQSPSLIQSLAITVPWDTIATTDIINDLMTAKKKIQDQGYNPEGATLLVSTKDYVSIVDYLINEKGSSIPNFSSDKITSGIVAQLLGLNIKVSLNVTADYALLIVPKRATTYAESQGITARNTEDAGIGTNVRVWASGIAYNTDPKAIVLLSNTQA